MFVQVQEQWKAAEEEEKAPANMKHATKDEWKQWLAKHG